MALNQNAVAAVLILSLPIALSLCLGSDSLPARITSGSAACVLLFELGLTDSRSAMLSLALALAVLLVFLGTRGRLLAAGLLAGVFWLLHSGVLGVGFAFGLLPTGGSSLERVTIWLSTLHMLADAPFTGIGLGMFQQIYPLYMFPQDSIDYPHAHNLVLQISADEGMLGCIGIVWLLVLVAMLVWSLRKTLAHDKGARWAVFGPAGASLALLFHGQVDSYFAGDGHTVFMLFLPIALLAGIFPLDVTPVASDAAEARNRRRMAMLVALGGLALLMVGWQWRLLVSEGAVNMGTLQRLRANVNSASAREMDSQEEMALTWFALARKIDPASWEAARGAGLAEFTLGDLQASIADLRRALTYGPGSRLQQFELARAYQTAGDEAAAMPHWRLALAAPYLVRTAAAESQAGDQSAAENSYRLALTVDPKQPGAYEGLASLYGEMGRWGDARREMEAEAAARPDLAWPFAYLGLMAFWREGNSDGAIALLKQAISRGPADESLYRAIAQVESADGLTGQASDWERQAQAALKHSGRPSPTLGLLYRDLGLTRSAEMEMRRVAYGVPSDPIGDYWLGRILLHQGERVPAIMELRRAVRAIPNQEDFRLALAGAYVRDNDSVDATRQFRVVLELDPGNSLARDWFSGGQARGLIDHRGGDMES